MSLTAEQLQAAKDHAFKFYERQSGHVAAAGDEAQAPVLNSFKQVQSTLRHLMDNCHHPAFIAVDLLCSVADREGSPQFKAACYLIRDGYNAMGKDAGEAMLRVVRTFDA